MREVSSIIIINELTKRGAKIKAYDPKAMDEVKEFRSPDFDEMKQRLKILSYLRDETSITLRI